MNSKIRIMVCDDHTLFRAGLVALLANEPDLEVVGEATDGQDCVDKARALHPDVILMDISMPRLNGFEATLRIVEIDKNIKILMLSMYDEDDLIIRCLEAGASGYVLKDAPADQLVHAIHEAGKGEKYLSPGVVSKVVTRYLETSSRPADTYDLLSGREREILNSLAEGLSVKEIAYRLMLSAKTVEVHKYNLMKKIDVHDRTELVKYALRKKLIRLSNGNGYRDE